MNKQRKVRPKPTPIVKELIRLRGIATGEEKRAIRECIDRIELGPQQVNRDKGKPGDMTDEDGNRIGVMS